VGWADRLSCSSPAIISANDNKQHSTFQSICQRKTNYEKVVGERGRRGMRRLKRIYRQKDCEGSYFHLLRVCTVSLTRRQTH
jgi:hypothetical protein